MREAAQTIFGLLRTRLGSLNYVVIRIELCGTVIPLGFLLASLFLSCFFLGFLLIRLFFLLLSLLRSIRFFYFSTFSFLALADKSLLTDFWTLPA